MSTEITKEYLIELNEKYVNGGEIDLEDGEFDAIQELYESQTGESLNFIGAKVDNGEEVELYYPMPSLNKIKGKDARKKMKKYMAEYQGPYKVLLKIDGTSQEINWDDEGNVTILTGGDGTYGKNASFLEEYLDLPDLLNVTIRGEMTMLNTDFKKLEPLLKKKGNKAKNSRNTVNGVVNCKTSMDPEIMEKCKFYAFSILSEQIAIDDEIEFLEEAGFNVPEHITVTDEDINKKFKSLKVEKTINQDDYDEDEEDEEDPDRPQEIIQETYEPVDGFLAILNKYLIEKQKTSLYRIDGLVITSIPNSEIEKTSFSNPEHSVAFKIDTIGAAKVSHIEWRLTSRYGYLIPVAKFEPIELLGVTISAATCHNAKFVLDHNIGTGAIVTLTLGGDIIPKIISGITPGDEPDSPDYDCHFNETEVQLILDDLDVRDVHIAQLIHFVKTLKMKHIGGKLITKMYDVLGITNIDKLLRMTREQFATLKKGKAVKSTERFFSEKKKSLDNITFAKIMYATCIFGENIGETVMESFIQAFPMWDVMDISKEEIIAVKGFGPVKSEQIALALPIFKNWIEKNMMCYPKDNEISDLPKDLLCQNILFTGKRNESLEANFIARGARIKKSFTNDVTLLVAENVNSGSGKTKKAVEKGIPIVPLKDVDNIVNYIKK